MRYWAESESHRTMQGPCLLPMWPVAHQALDIQYLQLKLRILVPESLRKSRTTALAFEGLKLENWDGHPVEPLNFTEYIWRDGHDDIERSFSTYQGNPVPRAYLLDSDKTFEIEYANLFYGNLKSFSVQPQFLIGSKRITGPRITFSRETKHKYVACELPSTLPAK